MTTIPVSTDRFITLRGIRLHYVDWGNTGAQPMLLLHGLQDCGRCWDFFAAKMARRYHVVALDHRGHGDSAATPDGTYPLLEYVAEVSDLIEALDFHNLLLIGHSAGGKNAFIYAAGRPERLSRLVIVDMDPDSYNPGSVQMVSRYKAEGDEYPDLEAVVERLRSREPNAPEQTLRHHAEVMTNPTRGGGRTWKRSRDVVTNYDRPDAWEYLDKIAVPTLIVRGIHSTLLTHDVAVRMQERIPDCRLVELPDSGHWCYDERPEEFEQVVTAFLDEK